MRESLRPSPTWRARAEEIGADVLHHAVDERVLIQRHDTQALDASVLLAPLLGLLRSDDERVCKTVPGKRCSV